MRKCGNPYCKNHIGLFENYCKECEGNLSLREKVIERMRKDGLNLK